SLALLLSRNAASASVPAPLVVSTVQAAGLFAAGGATSALPPTVVALTEGVLQAMSMTRLKMTVVMLFAFALAGVAPGILAQREPAARPQDRDPAARAQPRDGGRGQSPTEVRGVVKSVNGPAGTITLMVGFSRDSREPIEKTYNLAKDVEVGLGSAGGGRDGRGVALKEGKLGDVTPGATVLLLLTADQKSVE